MNNELSQNSRKDGKCKGEHLNNLKTESDFFLYFIGFGTD